MLKTGVLNTLSVFQASKSISCFSCRSRLKTSCKMKGVLIATPLKTFISRIRYDSTVQSVLQKEAASTCSGGARYKYPGSMLLH